MTLRSEIVAMARSYEGVKFRHQGRDRLGLDCAGLIIKVAHDLGIFAFDTADYDHLPNSGMMQQLCNKHLVRRHSIAIGSTLLLRFEGEPQHLAIATSNMFMIHALMEVRKVHEQIIDTVWAKRIVAIYDYPGVQDG